MQDIGLFFRINFFITTLFYLAFLSFNKGMDFESTLFSIAATISTAATLYLIIYLLFRLFFRYKVILSKLLSILFFSINFALVADFIIFKVWKFHINAMVVNILTSPSAWESLYVSRGAIIMIALLVLVLFLGEFLLFALIEKIPLQNKVAYNRRFNLFIVPILLLIILGEKISYGMADVYNKRPILESIKPIPLYQPLTFIRFVDRHFGIKATPKAQAQNTIDKNSQVHYPLHPIMIAPEAKSPNIFIFMFDAARARDINAKITPEIEALKKDALVFNNHISGGDATRFGIFSFFYGLNATYWFNFLHAQKEPVLFDVLKQKGYQIKIISSTTTQWPEFRQSVYCGVQDAISDDFEGAPYQKDAQSSKTFKNWIAKCDRKKPIFTFVFLDAPHGYSYPKNFEKFTPNVGGDGVNYITANPQNKEAFHNSYKNALAYDDARLGEMLSALKKRGLYKDAIVIFSSDHGEEFYEYGFLGHNSAFSLAQINTPLIFKLPNQQHKVINKMTSHLDIPATLLSMLGVKNPAHDYSCGSDIFAKDYKRSYCYIAKWNKNAIVTKNYTHIYSNLPNKLLKSEIRDTPHYQLQKEKPKDGIEKILVKVLEENRRFIK